MKQHAVLGFGLLALMLNPPAVKGLEASMVGYMLVQIPGLVAGGYYVGSWLLDRFAPAPVRPRWDPAGIVCLLVAIFTIAYWLLPRNVDAALGDIATSICKWLTLPLLAGIPLALGWRLLHPVAKGFVWANLVSMLGVMSWLYTSAPARLCNNYLEQQQDQLGQGMLLVGIAVAGSRVYAAFAGKPQANDRPDASDTREAL